MVALSTSTRRLKWPTPRIAQRALLDHLAGADTDTLRLVLEHAMQRLIEVEVTAVVGADHGERAPERRLTQRNGYRDRLLDTGVGRLELRIPKLRAVSFFPSLLQPRRRIDKALLAVILEAWVLGVSTRKVDDLMAALGGCTVSKSEVSWICGDLDEELAAFRTRSLDDGVYPYLWLDATFENVREGGRIVSQATVVAVGVRETGEKSILGVAVGPSETEAFWLEFLRSLLARGLHGVQLVIADAHQGLRAALTQCFAGATYQRCKVQFLRNIAAAVPKQHAPAVLAAVKAIFLQATPEAAHEVLHQAAEMIERRFPKVAAQIRVAEHEVLAYLTFPPDHWRSISSTNAVERVNAEIDRRAKVVGIFPNPESLLRLTTSVLQDQHDEWQDDRRLFSQHSLSRLLDPEGPPLLTNPLTEGLAA